MRRQHSLAGLHLASRCGPRPASDCISHLDSASRLHRRCSRACICTGPRSREVNGCKLLHLAGCKCPSRALAPKSFRAERGSVEGVSRECRLTPVSRCRGCRGSVDGDLDVRDALMLSGCRGCRVSSVEGVERCRRCRWCQRCR